VRVKKETTRDVMCRAVGEGGEKKKQAERSPLSFGNSARVSVAYLWMVRS
jgi:hypothetical protein